MRYLRLEPVERKALLGDLAAMPDFLETAFAGLDPEEARAPGPGGAFSPVEQSWHLADLEREGFSERIRRLRAEHDPWLADFDGDRIAAERRYTTRSLREGLQAFREARRSNLAALAAVAPAEWERRGRQEGVGVVALCDLPSLMSEHDASHRSEIDAWRRSRGAPAER